MVGLSAVTISSQVSISETQLSFSGVTYLTPHFSDDANKVIKYLGDKTNSAHLTPIQFMSTSIQASQMVHRVLGVYGELGTQYALHNSQIFASGSLEIKPQNFNPFLGIGTYYTAQNDARIELGANIAYLAYDLASNDTGTLFYGYKKILSKNLKAYPTDIQLSLSYPITENIQSVFSYAHSVSIFKTQLPINNNITDDHQSALLEEPINPKALYIGDYYGESADLQLNRLSIGIKLNIKEIYI